MKYQRIIHHLEDGRKKYSTHNGEMELWTTHEVGNINRNRVRFGDSAYTADFSKYDVEVKNLRQRYPKAKIIRVVGFESEDHDLPINPQIIF